MSRYGEDMYEGVPRCLASFSCLLSILLTPFSCKYFFEVAPKRTGLGPCNRWQTGGIDSSKRSCHKSACLRKRDPTRHAVFASKPLPDLQAQLEEK